MLALSAAFTGLATTSSQAQQYQFPTLVLPPAPSDLAARVKAGQPLVARYAVMPYRGDVPLNQFAPSTTIPMFSHTATLHGTHYTYKMVGKSPFSTQSNASTSIKTFIIPVKFTFTSFSNYIADPTAADPTCSPNGTALHLTQNSPVFKNISLSVGGTNVGTSQYVDLFQRASFWDYTKPSGINPGYHVLLKPVTTLATLSIPVSGGSVVSVSCGKIGEIAYSSWDSYVQNTIMPSLAGMGVGPTTLPIFLFYNVVLTDGGCCILGYHNAYSNGGNFQTYSIANYDTSTAFTGTGDISALTHEIGEWMDDPSGTNPTPPWGHIGQVSGCQNNLEVGDPLSGTIHAKALGGMTYHVQDLAFMSWFYQQGTSIGVNGWYSLYGKFKSKAKPCT